MTAPDAQLTPPEFRGNGWLLCWLPHGADGTWWLGRATLDLDAQYAKVPPAEQCKARADHAAAAGGELFCFLRTGHEGSHYDEVDRAWWTRTDGHAFTTFVPEVAS